MIICVINSDMLDSYRGRASHLCSHRYCAAWHGAPVCLEMDGWMDGWVAPARMKLMALSWRGRVTRHMSVQLPENGQQTDEVSSEVKLMIWVTISIISVWRHGYSWYGRLYKLQHIFVSDECPQAILYSSFWITNSLAPSLSLAGIYVALKWSASVFNK